jgi:hypothetical protein
LNRKRACVAQASGAQADAPAAQVQQQQTFLNCVPQEEATAPAAATNLAPGVAPASAATNRVQVKALAQVEVEKQSFVNSAARSFRSSVAQFDVAPAAAAAQVVEEHSIRNSWISTAPEVVPEPPVPAVSYVTQSTLSISVLSKKFGWNSRK